MEQSVELEAWSQRINAEPNETLEKQIAYYARVSNPDSQMVGKNDRGLIRYLIRHKHWSPFEMVSINLMMNTFRDIGRQALRHRFSGFQEYSGRYAPMPEPGGVRETRLQDHKNRQNSFVTTDQEVVDWFTDAQIQVTDLCYGIYKEALSEERGIAREQARVILPEGLTRTRMYVNGTVRSWIHYIELRSRPETQKEHRELAILCAKEIEKIFPMMEEFVYNESRETAKRYDMYMKLREEFDNATNR